MEETNVITVAKRTITAEDVGIPPNTDKLTNKGTTQDVIEWKPCPVTTTYNHIRIQCNKINGHPGPHSSWAHIHWGKGERPHADIDLHAHLADCQCILCTDPYFQKIKQQELARRGKA